MYTCVVGDERMMAEWDAIRPGEVATGHAVVADATLCFIGRASTPWARRSDCPRQGSPEGPECRILLDRPWEGALDGIEAFEFLDVLTWLDRSRRDLLVQTPGHGGGVPRGTFALRSPVRPNPIGLCRVRLVRRECAVLVVRGLDCVDGTPILDLKPDRCGGSA